MTIRKIRSLLWVTGCALLAGAIGAGWLTASLPLRVEGGSTTEAAHRPSPSSRPARGKSVATPTLESLSRIDLRRPLYDPPPVVAHPPSQPPAQPLSIRLVGTIVEPGHSKAVLVGADGKTQLKAVGETAAGAEILEIAADQVIVRYQGAPATLTLPNKSKDPAGTP